MSRSRIAYCAAIVLVMLAHSSAWAQATRTWVSGVGDDANPGSRTAPCKTFAGAISKTAAGGEIDCLDPGGFGAVTITKAITIDGGGTFASILGSGTNGIVVNAGPNDVVTIRNLSINGAGTGLNGIRFLSGAALHIENCVIFNFAQKGLDFEPTGASQLFIKDTTIHNNNNSVNGGAVFLKPGAAGSVKATLDHVRLEANLFGVRAEPGSNVMIRDSVVSASSTSGILAVGSSGVVIHVEDTVVSHNATNGIRSGGAQCTVRISNVMVMDNGTGLGTAGGALISFGNNRIAGNTTDGAPTATVAQQ